MTALGHGRLSSPVEGTAGLPSAPEMRGRSGSYAWCQERSFAVMAVAGSDLMLVKLGVDWTSAQGPDYE
jgi:hypothetical protein